MRHIGTYHTLMYAQCTRAIPTTQYDRLSDTVKPSYSGHPWDVANWLLYKGGLIIQTECTNPLFNYNWTICDAWCWELII